MKALTHIAGAVAALALCSSAAMATAITPLTSLTDGTLTFSNFTCIATSTGTGTADCTGLDVSIVNGDLQIAGGVGSGADGSADVLLSFTVTSTTPITGIDLGFDGAFNGTGSTRTTEQALSNGVVVGQLTVTCNASTNPCDLQDPPLESPPDIQLSGSFFTLDITKDIFATSGGTNTGSASLSTITQSFHSTTVPEPASLALLGSALAGFGLYRRRRQNAA